MGADYAGTSTIVGWSAFDAANTKMIMTKKIGKTVFVSFILGGTSNNATTTFTVPYTNVGGLTAYGISCNSFATIGNVDLGNNGVTVTVHRDGVDTAFPSTGSKYVYGSLFYESA